MSAAPPAAAAPAAPAESQAPQAAAPAAAPVDQYMYSVDGRTRGPLPGKALLKLLERGVVPANAAVWAPGFAAWMPILEATGLGERAALARGQFFVADETKPEGRAGPFPLGELRRRFDAGEVDGLTAVFVAGGSAWAPLGRVPNLRELLAPEEEMEETTDAANQVYEPEAIPQEPGVEDKASKKRSFRGDDGARYKFEGGEWVPAGDDDESDGDEEAVEEAPAEDPDKAAKAAERKAKREKKKAAKKKGGWDAKAAKCWIYVTGLPSDATAEELHAHFGKCGVVACDPETSAPKIKLYRDDAGLAKGDASLCYANEASVGMAVDILDGGSLRFDVPLKVARADFGSSRYGAFDPSKKRKVNANKIKVAKKAQAQAMSWANDDDSGAVSSKALRIVVVERAFRLEDLPPEEAVDDGEGLDTLVEKKRTAFDDFADALRAALLGLLEGEREVNKCTVHRKRADGVVTFKFTRAADAAEAAKVWNGASFRGQTLASAFWDGVTDYTRPLEGTEEQIEAADAERAEAFGDWLENQDDLPEELRLRVEE